VRLADALQGVAEQNCLDVFPVLTLPEILVAGQRAARGKRRSADVAAFMLDAERCALALAASWRRHLVPGAAARVLDPRTEAPAHLGAAFPATESCSTCWLRQPCPGSIAGPRRSPSRAARVSARTAACALQPI